MKIYTLSMLTEKSVSVKVETYDIIGGEQKMVGLPLRKVYMNSVSGRKSVISELPKEEQDLIFANWGENPTFIEEEVVGIFQ